jgi:glycosyltransferase involved in cell wall biosynthesis
MKDFEIILVNDNSNDGSLRIINKMKKDDDRIKIINNHKNMGTLYSRCIGSLNAKGKYIFPLDNDDLFLDEDVFETIYNFASEYKYNMILLNLKHLLFPIIIHKLKI